MLVFQLFWAFVFSILSWQFSSPDVFKTNLLDIVTFTAVGMVLYCTISCEHVRQVVDHLRLEEETKRINAIQSAILMSLSNVIEGRDDDTGGHVVRTCSFVADLLGDLREQESWRARLPETFVSRTVLCASLHDMGKLRIPDAILNKPGRLTDEEFEIMKLHTVYGEQIIQHTLRGLIGDDGLAMACNIARSHHERWDGTGYPDGLAGEDIPIEARAMALADVFDALTHERCYKRAFSVEEAIRIIEEGRGTQFDPEMTDVFIARRRVQGCSVDEERMRRLERLKFGTDDDSE
jgi:HD-GYP domain-containing protein (c-di-GMP phosphodiesterase class II)